MLPHRSSRARPAASPPAPKRRACGSCGRSHLSASAADACIAAASATVAKAVQLAAAVAAATSAVQRAAAVTAAAIAAALPPLPPSPPPPPAVPRTAVSTQVSGAFVAEIDLIKLELCASCGEAEFGLSHVPYDEGRSFVVNPKCSKCVSKHSKHRLKFCQQNLMHLQPPPSDLPILTDIEE